jgi:hypothetical protein
VQSCYLPPIPSLHQGTTRTLGGHAYLPNPPSNLRTSSSLSAIFRRATHTSPLPRPPCRAPTGFGCPPCLRATQSPLLVWEGLSAHTSRPASSRLRQGRRPPAWACNRQRKTLTPAPVAAAKGAAPSITLVSILSASASVCRSRDLTYTYAKRAWPIYSYRTTSALQTTPPHTHTHTYTYTHAHKSRVRLHQVSKRILNVNIHARSCFAWHHEPAIDSLIYHECITLSFSYDATPMGAPSAGATFAGSVTLTFLSLDRFHFLRLYGGSRTSYFSYYTCRTWFGLAGRFSKQHASLPVPALRICNRPSLNVTMSLLPPCSCSLFCRVPQFSEFGWQHNLPGTSRPLPQHNAIGGHNYNHARTHNHTILS